jgi:hypothetical protein
MRNKCAIYVQQGAINEDNAYFDVEDLIKK